MVTAGQEGSHLHTRFFSKFCQTTEVSLIGRWLSADSANPAVVFEYKLNIISHIHQQEATERHNIFTVTHQTVRRHSTSFEMMSL